MIFKINIFVFQRLVFSRTRLVTIYFIGFNLDLFLFTNLSINKSWLLKLASLKFHEFKNLIVVIFKINIFVLKAGANPGFKDKAGRHSLHWAAHHGHVKCLKSLLNSKSAAAATTSDQHPSNLTLMAERDNVIIRSTMLKNLTIFHISLMHIRPILF